VTQDLHIDLRFTIVPLDLPAAKHKYASLCINVKHNN
jgi:hypothetical protein